MRVVFTLAFLSAVGVGAAIGCSAPKKYTIFYDAKKLYFYNTHGEACIQSGLEVNTDRKTLVEKFYNCNFYIERKLEERELKQWLLD